MKLCLCLFYTVFCFFFGQAQSGKIPLSSARWYQLNSISSNLDRLTDGDIKTVFFPGWSMMMMPYEAYYPLLEGEQMTVDSLRMYDREGIYVNYPIYIYAITDQWERKLLATFTGERYLSWVGPYPSRPNVFKLDSAVGNIQYLMLQIYGNGFPAELELYGHYTPPTPNPVLAAPPAEPLKRMFGINGFAWNLTEQTGSTIYVSEAKLNAMRSFGAFRQYLDWQKSEPVEGRYYFSPQDGGGWPLDTIYRTLRDVDIDVVATIQNITNWMNATYPDSLKGIDNSPVRYGRSFSDPASYIEQAKLGFQFTARYGRNANLDPGLVSIYNIPAWHNQIVNTKKIGLGLVRYIECGNEVDKNWRGRKGYLSGREYAANLSAFYDGHLNTLGPGVGVKNADSSMQVVMSGIAFPTTDYLRGMIDWCREFRGYKADGRVNLCFDVINYHYYSSDRKFFQGLNSTRGMAPEKSIADSIAKNFIEAAHIYAHDLPVWISEHGYDIHQGSPLRAMPAGNRSAEETQADWTLRSGLLYSRRGFHRSFFYQVFDANVDYGGKYASMGLIVHATKKRKPAADFLYQTIRRFGDYRFQETLNSDPFVDRYQYNDSSMYVLLVPDEIGRMVDYSLQLPGADSAIIYTPTAGSDTMSFQKVATLNGTLPIAVSETPVFVVPCYPAMIETVTSFDSTIVAGTVPQALFAGRTVAPAIAGTEKADPKFSVFPNPTTGALYIQNNRVGQWRVLLLNLQGKKIEEMLVSGQHVVIHLDRLPSGIYPLYMLDDKGNRFASRFVVKQ